jgi:hypothetical protein
MENSGYGGNQMTCNKKALKEGADIVIKEITVDPFDQGSLMAVSLARGLLSFKRTDRFQMSPEGSFLLSMLAENE